MKKIVRRIAVVIGAVAVSVGLIGATAAPSDATPLTQRMSDTQWG
jgi:ABC-type glycerol-3-phosphate transport system substrate-binding protein